MLNTWHVRFVHTYIEYINSKTLEPLTWTRVRPFPLLWAHPWVLTCSVLSLFNISKYTTFKPITRVCYSVYYPNNGSHLNFHICVTSYLLKILTELLLKCAKSYVRTLKSSTDGWLQIWIKIVNVSSWKFFSFIINWTNKKSTTL